ncbi:GNAT family N-acetyltransferase [Streptococcus pneumoniae]
METYYLSKPTEKDLPFIETFKQEFSEKHQHLNGGSRLSEMPDLAAWLSHIKQQEEQPKPDRAPSTTLIFKRQNEDKIIGIVNIRHHIEQDFLVNVAGHIGYSIAPSEQGKGLAKVQLTQALEFCRHLGLTKVLVTCASWNVASRQTILAQPHCHYEDSRLAPDGDTMERYWIDLKK